MEQLLMKISEKYKKTPSMGVFTDMFAMVRECGKTDLPLALKYGRELSDFLDSYIPFSGAAIRDLFGLHKRVLHWLAPNDFHSAILYAK